MTIKELSQLYYLNREIEIDKEHLKGLREQLSYGSQSMDGMPKSSSVNNRTAQYITEIIDLEAIISAKLTQCIHERNRLERYISSISDSLTRQIFTLRFINGFSWAQIAFSVGGGNTSEGVRKKVYRYLRQTKNN